ncbi:hypothetical protein [Kaistella antarctica]|uniref:Uncharacterized protein n=1 Tax=Kaistella antarctica TaxID=266748 RepID=A0A448NNR5_9FLAO|nr:hypothetical protein [Kaistella antarctica]KEY19660.1 hypothetical protein HY04_00010 [Kaistella antarctica]SEV99300.1 hypothetical protein SAMN05421765_1771 [Kaistella antarctica]VEH96833.1 Uncharacterised protein [Kaistella antarctica]
MKIPNFIFLIVITLSSISCVQERSKLYSNKVELNKIKDSLKKTINDSIAKSDSMKIIIGVAKLNKKSRVILYDNYKWEYKTANNLNSQNNQKVAITKIQPIMQTVKPIRKAATPIQTEYMTNESGLCGALTKKGGSCRRKVKGGGRCWQH